MIIPTTSFFQFIAKRYFQLAHHDQVNAKLCNIHLFFPDNCNIHLEYAYTRSSETIVSIIKVWILVHPDAVNPDASRFTEKCKEYLNVLLSSMVHQTKKLFIFFSTFLHSIQGITISCLRFDIFVEPFHSIIHENQFFLYYMHVRSKAWTHNL